MQSDSSNIGNTPVVPDNQPAATPSMSPQQTQIQQVRQTVLSQVAELKQQIQTIQQQALQNMLSDIDNVFTTQLNTSVQQIINQQQAAQITPVTSPVEPGTQTLVSPYISPQVLNAGNQAAGIAASNVNQAMEQAQKSVRDAENALNSMGNTTNT